MSDWSSRHTTNLFPVVDDHANVHNLASNMHKSYGNIYQRCIASSVSLQLLFSYNLISVYTQCMHLIFIHCHWVSENIVHTITLISMYSRKSNQSEIWTLFHGILDLYISNILLHPSIYITAVITPVTLFSKLKFCFHSRFLGITVRLLPTLTKYLLNYFYRILTFSCSLFVM